MKDDKSSNCRVKESSPRKRDGIMRSKMGAGMVAFWSNGQLGQRKRLGDGNLKIEEPSRNFGNLFRLLFFLFFICFIPICRSILLKSMFFSVGEINLSLVGNLEMGPEWKSWKMPRGWPNIVQKDKKKWPNMNVKWRPVGKAQEWVFRQILRNLPKHQQLCSFKDLRRVDIK